MWRVTVVQWPQLPEPERAALRGVVDQVVPEVDGDGYLVVDERCPGLDGQTLRAVLERARDRPAVGVRPVTDTVKRLRDGTVVGTVDRAGLVQVASPLAVPSSRGEPLGESLPVMAAEFLDIELVEVTAAARRLSDVEELRLLG